MSADTPINRDYDLLALGPASYDECQTANGSEFTILSYDEESHARYPYAEEYAGRYHYLTFARGGIGTDQVHVSARLSPRELADLAAMLRKAVERDLKSGESE